MSPSAFELSFPEADIAHLVFDLPGKSGNILSSHVLEEFSGRVDEIASRNDLSGLIISSGKPGMFVAGADLREFVASFDAPPEKIVEMCRLGQSLFERLSKCPFATVAAIDGVCLGGGGELAIWCDRRVMSNHPRTEFGFPEVKLGLYPGWGGTVRLPRVIGLANAVEMITSGETSSAGQCREMGLASEVTSSDRLIEAAIKLARAEKTSGDFLRDRQRWSEPININETELGFLGATASAVIRGQTKGNYPAPEQALELMLETALLDASAALVEEAQGMAQLFGSPVNRSLVNVFFLTDRNKRDTGLSSQAQEKISPREIKSASVLGAGIMGAGIAAANLKREIRVFLSDASPEALLKGAENVLQEASYNKTTKGADAQRAIALAPRLSATDNDSVLAKADLVIEAVVENAEVKKEVFAKLEPKMRDDAILASNTSTIPITSLAENLSRPEQFCGIHFFNPVRRMKLVEVIRGAKTSDQTVATAVAYAKRLGKMPIVIKDGPGFLVNRLLFPYMNQALELLCEGASPDQIDRAAKKFGMPMGPIALYDVVGLDTALYAGKTMADAFPDRVSSSPLLADLVQRGRLGEKSGAGFFSYRNRKKRAWPSGPPAATPDPEFEPILSAHRKAENSFTTDQLIHRLFFPMLLEATRTLEEKTVRDVRDVDLGLIFGIGFPPFKGGLLYWADTVGAAQLMEMLQPYQDLGGPYKPTPLLTQMAENGDKFYLPQGTTS